MPASLRAPVLQPSPPHPGVARRRLRHERRQSPTSLMSLNLTPMIDMVFLLLIFFVLTTTFRRAEGLLGAQLPRGMGAPSVALPISPIVVRLRPTGPGGRDFAIQIDNFRDTPASAGELSRFFVDIRQTPGFDEQTPVVILPTPDVAWQHVVDCWNAAVRAGCRTITFARE